MELRLSNLYLQELRALPRARFALAGSAVFAAVLTALAVVLIPSPLGLWSFAELVYGLGPILLGAFAAFQMANLRTSRLIDSLFTLPVRGRTVLWAHLLVALTLGALYLVATLPFLAIAGLHVGVPVGVLRLLLGGAVMMVFAAVLGTLVGVFFTGRSVAAPVGLTIGFLLLAMLAIIPAASMQLDGALQGSLLMRVLHMSPYVLVSDGLGLLGWSVAAAARSPGWALSLVGLQIAGLLALTAWAFLREQGPERWESRPTRRAVLTVLAALVLLGMPLALADDAYQPIEPRATERYSSSSLTEGAWVVVVPPGTPAREADFRDHRAGTSEDPLDATGSNARDLLIRLPVTTDVAVADVVVTFDAGPFLTVAPTDHRIQQPASPEANGGRVVLRIPVVLTPADPVDLTSNTYQLWTNVTYTADGTEQSGRVLAAFHAHVPWALVQLGAAGAPLFLLTTIGAVTRRIRVG